MRSFLSLARKAVRRFPNRVALALVVVMLASLCAAAQQPAVGRKRNPRLTTDDLVGPPPDQPAADATKETAPAKPEDAAKAQPEAKTTEAKAGDAQVSAEETAWRERVVKARERAKQAERAADEMELRITDLRNQLGLSGQTARDRNETAAEMERAGRELNELRRQARAAADDANQLVELGKARSYREAEGPKAKTAEGKPNDDYYRGRYAKLLEDAATAERRMQLYELRVRDISQRILMNGGKDGGDNFYLAQLQQEKQDYQQKLDEAREARNKAQSDLDALMEEAHRAGVEPGVFK